MNRFLIFIFLSLTSYSQNFQGTISDSSGIVPFASILIKKINDPLVIFQYTKTNDQGFFSIELKEKPEFLFIEVNSFSHETKVLYPKDFASKNPTFLNIFLEPKINSLEDVIITRKLPVQITKDTTTFDPDFFKDGSERVVEDLLKKLPGVEVQENGIIKFKGKIIQKLLLDGDDLFGTQYKIGSKNINVEMIDKVQGLEHYEENALLRGINNSDDVALNLVLKKGKSDWSGNLNLGYGYEKNIDNSLTAIVVNKKIKAFGVASYNNIGQNNTPYTIESNFRSSEASEEKRSETVLNQGNFGSLLDSKFHRLNNNLYTSGNSLFKIHKKSSIKLNIGFYDDNLTRNNKGSTNYNLDNEQLSINESNNLSKKSRLYDLQTYYSNKEKNFFHWDYKGKMNYYSTTFKDYSTNNANLQNNNVNTHALFLAQNISSTYKISDSTVIVSKFNYSKSNIPQNLTIIPGTKVDEINSLFSAKQYSCYETDLLNFEASLLSNKKDYKYAVYTSYKNINSTLSSKLNDDQNNSLGNLYENNNRYKLKLFSLQPVFIYKKSKFSLKFSTNFFNTDLNFVDFIRITKTQLQNFYATPSVSFNYSLNKNNSFNSSYFYNALIPQENKLFSGIIQTNYRNFSNNTLALDFLKSHNYNLGYSYNNLYDSKIFRINLSYNFKPNNYFTNTFVNQNITVNNSFLADLITKDYNIDMYGETYYHPLRTTFKVNGNFTLSSNKNIINNSEIRKIQGQILYLNFTARIGLTSKTSFENNIGFFSNSFRVSNTTTNYESLTNQTKFLFKPNKEFSVVSIANVITPDLKDSKNYLFLEGEFNYNPENKNYGISLITKNLTNNKTFKTKSISDFSTSTRSHNLIERYIMVKVFLSF